jgi:hypothetical protein
MAQPFPSFPIWNKSFQRFILVNPFSMIPIQLEEVADQSRAKG